MTPGLQDQSALEWASTVTPRHYADHRDEFDDLVIAVVPSYQAMVHDRLDDFGTRVMQAQERYDANHSAPQFMRPWPLRWLQHGLFWVFFLGITSSFAFIYPVGGRAMGAVNYSLVDWPLWVMLSSICFAAGVIAQLVRRLPVRPGIPPRKDLAWYPTALGVPALAGMILYLNVRVGIQPEWIVLTAVALAVSIVYCLTRLVQRRRDPELTRQVDMSEKKRMRIWANNLKAQTDQCADRIERDFAALPNGDRARVLGELAAATAVLRERGLIRTLSTPERKFLARRLVKGRRPMVPGLLLLESRMQQAWKPLSSEPGMVLGVTWLVMEYLPNG